MRDWAARVADRYFEPSDVEQLIPRLREIMTRVLAAHAEASEARAWLDGEERRITVTGGGVVDRRAWQAARDRLEREAPVVQQGLAAIEALGGVTKDLTMGLVDFPHLREGRVVNLCWRYGEERITHWHGLDEGFARRKPL
jgi:hypothetical protein